VTLWENTDSVHLFHKHSLDVRSDEIHVDTVDTLLDCPPENVPTHGHIKEITATSFIDKITPYTENVPPHSYIKEVMATTSINKITLRNCVEKITVPSSIDEIIVPRGMQCCSTEQTCVSPGSVQAIQELELSNSVRPMQELGSSGSVRAIQELGSCRKRCISNLRPRDVTVIDSVHCDSVATTAKRARSVVPSECTAIIEVPVSRTSCRESCSSIDMSKRSSEFNNDQHTCVVKAIMNAEHKSSVSSKATTLLSDKDDNIAVPVRIYLGFVLWQFYFTQFYKEYLQTRFKSICSFKHSSRGCNEVFYV